MNDGGENKSNKLITLFCKFSLLNVQIQDILFDDGFCFDVLCLI